MRRRAEIAKEARERKAEEERERREGRKGLSSLRGVTGGSLVPVPTHKVPGSTQIEGIGTTIFVGRSYHEYGEF